jgi:hypothetical protein
MSACGSSSLLRHSGVTFALAAVALVLSASAPAATPSPEPTPEAKALPKPEPAPTARPRGGSTPQRVAPRPRVFVPRSTVPVRPRATRRATSSAAAEPAAKPAAKPVKRSPARSRRGRPPVQKATPLVVERRAPIDPPLAFVSAPVVFPDEGGPALLAALALLALLAASASHLGLLYAVWRRVPG